MKTSTTPALSGRSNTNREEKSSLRSKATAAASGIRKHLGVSSSPTASASPTAGNSPKTPTAGGPSPSPKSVVRRASVSSLNLSSLPISSRVASAATKKAATPTHEAASSSFKAPAITSAISPLALSMRISSDPKFKVPGGFSPKGSPRSPRKALSNISNGHMSVADADASPTSPALLAAAATGTSVVSTGLNALTEVHAAAVAEESLPTDLSAFNEMGNYEMYSDDADGNVAEEKLEVEDGVAECRTDKKRSATCCTSASFNDLLQSPSGETCASEDTGDILSESAMSEQANGARDILWESAMSEHAKAAADMLSESGMSEQANEKAVDECWSPEVDTLVKLPNKRRSAILSKNSDIITQRLREGDEQQRLRGDDELSCAEAEHASCSSHYYSSADTERIALQLDALQEEQISALQAQLRQERQARLALVASEVASTSSAFASTKVQILTQKALLEEREATHLKAERELESKILMLEDTLTRARDTTTDKKTAQKLRKLLGQQESAIEQLCRHVDAQDIMATLTQAGLSHGKTTAADAMEANSRHSLEIMCTLLEEADEDSEEVSDGRTSVHRHGVLTGRNLVMLVNLRKELDREKDEKEELRQTADCCFVREQESKRRCEELESENREMQAFTDQMASAHTRLTQGVMELTAKQATMVTQEMHEEALAEIEKLKEDQLLMVPHLNSLLEEVEALKAAAACNGEAEQLLKLKNQCEQIKLECDAQTAACAELSVSIGQVNAALQLEKSKCEQTAIERDMHAAAAVHLESKNAELEREVELISLSCSSKFRDLEQEIEILREAAAGGEAALAQLLSQSERAQLAELNCEQLRQQLAEQATRIAELEVSSADMSKIDEVKELEAARIRIKDLESEVQSNKDKLLSMAREGHEEAKRLLELREKTYREQYDCCKQRISALEQERDKMESERDEALRAFTEVEEISSGMVKKQTQWGRLQWAVLVLLNLVVLLWVLQPMNATPRRLALIL